VPHVPGANVVVATVAVDNVDVAVVVPLEVNAVDPVTPLVVDVVEPVVPLVIDAVCRGFHGFGRVGGRFLSISTCSSGIFLIFGIFFVSCLVDMRCGPR
jgi:hypothetical protein